MNGKGDKQIPPQVSYKEYRDNHDGIRWGDSPMNREQLIDKYGEEAFNEALAISGKIIETEVAKVRKLTGEAVENMNKPTCKSEDEFIICSINTAEFTVGEKLYIDPLNVGCVITEEEWLSRKDKGV